MPLALASSKQIVLINHTFFISQSVDLSTEKRALISWFQLEAGNNIKQAIQGLFTAGTSEKKEKVGS